MKKVIALMSIVGLLAFTNFNGVMAQDAVEAPAAEATEQVDEQANDSAVVDEAAAEEMETVATEEEETKSFHQVLKEKYIEGGALWMTPVLLCLIFGLALIIERILYLNMATTNVEKLLNGIEENVSKGNIEGAKTLCRETRGPVASIFYQGLDRINNGLEDVEKSLTNYGGVQMKNLESNLTWISLFIALAPSFGFLGTCIGMVKAFDDIVVAGDISPVVVASGMKLALITTVFGLIVAIILQIFFNYILTKIESLVAQMEDGSITFMDILVKYNK